MKRKSRGKKFILKNESGFTLIEMLIVVIVLGILAMIIVPQITVSTEDAKLRTLQTNLSTMRSAIETYYAQHGQTYPGKVSETDGSAPADNAAAATAFVKQLTLYTNADGKASDTVSTAYPFGPYIKGGALPTNPYADNKNDIVADKDENVITGCATLAAVESGKAWKFCPQTGILIAADGAHSTE